MKKIINFFLLFFILIIFTRLSGDHEFSSKLITVIGTGYVGLVTGVGLADIGNVVICADIDREKIDLLKRGEIPIYEIGLQEKVKKNMLQGRLFFTHDIDCAIRNAEVIFIAVGTPMGIDGSADLSALESVIELIAKNINSYKTICIKSTVPSGTGTMLRKRLESHGIAPDFFDIVSNPEFLREGSAINDFLNPDRIIIGTESERARLIMKSIYETFADQDIPIVYTDIATAEVIKYASNAFLSVKISYINEMANLCDSTNADIRTVAYAMGLDKRISPLFLNPGPGFGGSCFPKDCSALLQMAVEYGLNLNVVKAALDANEQQKEIPIKKLKKLFSKKEWGEQLADKVIAVLGLAFKANTDDVRCSPAIKTIELLLKEGAIIKAYDPIANENMRKLFSDITYCSSPYEAVEGADALIVMTEWDEFKKIDLECLSKCMKQKVVVDARGILNQEKLQALSFCFDVIGKECHIKSKLEAD